MTTKLTAETVTARQIDLLHKRRPKDIMLAQACNIARGKEKPTREMTRKAAIEMCVEAILDDEGR